jgi:glycerol-3-phosphate dehydrogenase
VDDARLVISNARDAADRGAQIFVGHEVIAAQRKNDCWVIKTCDADLNTQEFCARVLINAAGPWVSKMTESVISEAVDRKIRLIRGSHIVVPKMYGHDRCYILQNSDGRIVFAIPYEDDFTLIGTTDEEHRESLDQIEIDKSETEYLCRSVSDYFKKTVQPEDVVWSYSAVRPLFDDGNSDAQSVTRDYQVISEGTGNQPPLISILGGKITTYRTLAEDVMDKVADFFDPLPPSWTGSRPLPGGSFDHLDFEDELGRLRAHYPFLSERYARRLMRMYGNLGSKILKDAKRYDDLGEFFGGNLYESEVRYLIEHEWARSVEDILWRRTKEGLRLSKSETAKLDQFLKRH